ncbi:hypothetical protein [Pedobacter sp. SL55]|uniref:hypothetical protein n=1 Tax=Pedobacter sp. SL55 TaxID=2995161 RepID=UPI00226E6265|nr:hypothetical protein [Pedobacter sp. SL55]WAC39714.1 hypothetical protein OVA16_14145 [Pedobacter sp. SL55]
MNILIEKLPANDRQRKWMAIAITVVISILLTLVGIYLIGEYGIALFVLTPFFMGLCPTILYGLKHHITKKDAWQMGLLTLLIFTSFLLFFAIEGLICIAMAAPLAILFTWLGGLIGFAIVQKGTKRSSVIVLIFLGFIPTTAFIEKDVEHELNSVVTSIEIKADLSTVWENVVEFPELETPQEFIFRTGIAYPINAKIDGAGVGAIRYCNFTTGSFVEPITVWNEPSLLKFDVLEQPAPMKEISFWDIDAPHLHDYFVSKKGQFKLTKLPNGNTLLEGTTWYYHHIKPAFYWKGWSEYIIHQIHLRVLKHIKKNAEKDKLICNIK